MVANDKAVHNAGIRPAAKLVGSLMPVSQRS